MKEGLKGWTDAIIEAIIIFVIMFFVFFPVQVDGPSMEKTLYDGDRIFVSRIMAYTELYDRGDIIVFEHSIEGKTIKMVKRIIAVEGDTVEIKDGSVYVNGDILNEDYINGYTGGDTIITVDDDCVFVLGDNRESSVDSRSYGAVNKDEITAKVVMKFYPFSDICFY